MPESKPKRVITVSPMPPEKCAYALARYSRSPDSIRDSLEWVRTHDSQKFLESFYFQYGHASIADLGHAVLCFEGLSELAASEIEDEPLWDGQAKSSRYQDFSRAGFITPPELTGDAVECYQAAARKLLAAYAQVNALAFDCLAARLPRPDEMKPEAYRRNIAARAFDVARYLLFWGMPTNVGQVTSIRTLEKQIRRLKAAAYQELRDVGDEIAQACAAEPDCVWDANAVREPLAPTLARHAEADENAARAQQNLRRWADQNLTRYTAGDPPRVDLIRPTETAAEIVATLLYPVTDWPFRELYEMARGWSAAQRGEVLDVALESRSRRDELLARLPRRTVRLRFRHRHRRVSRPAPPSALPQVPPGLLRTAGFRYAGAVGRGRRRGGVLRSHAGGLGGHAELARSRRALPAAIRRARRASCSRWISPKPNISRACAAA